jgi:hypothetical protein
MWGREMRSEESLQWLRRYWLTAKGDIAIWTNQDQPLIADPIVSGERAIRIKPPLLPRIIWGEPSDEMDV